MWENIIYVYIYCIWYADVTFIYQALFYVRSHSLTVLQQLVYDNDGQMPNVYYFFQLPLSQHS